MKKLLLLIFAVVSLNPVLAQETESKPKTPIGGRPNIPSDLNFEFGFNQLNNRPSDIGVNFFGSRTFNVSYQFPIEVGEKTGFTINPGFGIGSDKLEFSDSENLFPNPTLGKESSRLIPVSDIYGDNIVLKKNNFSTNYFEVPIDIRYHFNKNNYSKSFRVSLGAKVGYLYEAHTKIKYESAAEGNVKIKDSQNYGLEKFRYAITFKAGSPGFYVWSNFYLNQMWQPGRGPFATQASQINFGIAVTVF
ncbi:outer membrane protein with beta-barrel domain [Algoriphagus boseongensis]|uniref:Outer membrane protein with beta-barrel domain n=1 Tax=Algoriphagus boseongensis TaxID=1442587 RepID=A0A4R6T1F9_9BACT|nr:porin family protein [Algoriphagus boseongensis]TDQ15040.1 outer membrane protein with beta-barrel domain [Algoriphagus boseongensis]